MEGSLDFLKRLDREAVDGAAFHAPEEPASRPLDEAQGGVGRGGAGGELGEGQRVDLRHTQGSQAQAQIGPKGAGWIFGKTGQEGGRGPPMPKIHARGDRTLRGVLESVEGEPVAPSFEDHPPLDTQEDRGARIFRGIEEEGPGPQSQPGKAGMAFFRGEARHETHAKAHGQDRPEGLSPDSHHDLRVKKV